MVDGGGWEGGTVVKESWGSGVSGGQSWGSGVVSGVGVLDDGGGPGDLDNVLSSDWDWDGHMVWLLDVDGGGHLDQLLHMNRDVVWDGVWLLHMNRLVDDVGLLLNLDDSWVDLLGSLQGSWHSDADVWDGWLEDLGVVAGDVGLLTVVHLLGDLLWSLVDGDDGLTLNRGGGVWGWHADGWGGDSQGWGWGSDSQGWGGNSVVAVGKAVGKAVVQAIGQWGGWQDSGGSWGHDVSGGGGCGSNHGGEDCGHWVHDVYKEWFYPKDK